MPPQDPETSRWFAAEVAPHEGSLRAYLHRQFPRHPDIDDLSPHPFGGREVVQMVFRTLSEEFGGRH